MNIDQVRAAAEAQSFHRSGPSSIKIHVGSLAADSKAAMDRSDLRARIVRTGSFGYYDLEPIVRVQRPGLGAVLYHNVMPDEVADLVKASIEGTWGKAHALCCVGPERVGDIPHISEVPLFNLQNRIALRNCGWIDPDDIADYIHYGQGYRGLGRALNMNPSDLTEVMIPAALKGRQGAGCSAPSQWELFSRLGKVDRYLICNAVDPDPRSLTSQLLLESDPHSVLEGMLISAFAVGASRCFIFVEEKTGKKLSRALDQMRAYNLLGSNILDSPFSSEIEIHQTPASWLLGHGIELFRCVAEKQLLPHMLDPYRAASEFMGKPILMANPEIMSSLSAALRDGMGDGMESTVVTLSGSVMHTYTVEVPPATTIGSLIERLGGGVPNGKTIKALQLGGPEGPFVAPDAVNLPIGCAFVEESNSGIGSRTVEVLDSDSRMVDRTKDIMAYLQAQSCGKCVFCREGCLQMLTILEDISENKGKPKDLDLLVELGEEMRAACLCAFGRAAPNPVLSGIRLFRAEYDAHPSGPPVGATGTQAQTGNSVRERNLGDDCI